MTKKITLAQVYEIEIPRELRLAADEELLDYINAMYDINGKNIISCMSAENDYQYTQLTEIDDTEVYIEDGKVSLDGSLIILDDQQLESK